MKVVLVMDILFLGLTIHVHLFVVMDLSDYLKNAMITTP